MELAAAMPFRKIRVGELCRRCGVDRRTFYYHFKDVYDLAAWIFDRATDGNLPNAEGRFTHAGLVRTLAALRQNQAFYRRALEENSQNALGPYVMERTVTIYEAAIRAQKGTDCITERESFAIQYHSVGSLTMLRRWMLQDKGPDPEEMATRLSLVMPPMLRALYAKPAPENNAESTNTGGKTHE